MKFIEGQYQSSIMPYISRDPGNLESYLEWKNLQDEIDDLKKKREELLISTRTIPELKEEMREILKEMLKKTELDLREEIIGCQERRGGGRTDVIVEHLIRVKNLKDAEKNIEYIYEKTYPVGIPKGERESKIERIEKRIKEVQKEQEKFVPKVIYGQLFYQESQYIEIWYLIAPKFLDICDAGGRYLHPENERDRWLIKVYKRLKLDELPKMKLSRPIIINEKEYEVPPSHGSPLWEK